jgi:hypothetical protein
MSIFKIPFESFQIILDQFDRIVASPCTIDRTRKWSNLQLVSMYFRKVIGKRIYKSPILNVSPRTYCPYCKSDHFVLLGRFVNHLLEFPDLILHVENLLLRVDTDEYIYGPVSRDRPVRLLALGGFIEKIGAILKSAKLKSFSLETETVDDSKYHRPVLFDYVMDGNLAGKGLEDLSRLSTLKSLRIPFNGSTFDGLLGTFRNSSLWPSLECLTLETEVYWCSTLSRDNQRYLCDMLDGLSSLKELNLRDILLEYYPRNISRLSVTHDCDCDTYKVYSDQSWIAITRLSMLRSVEIDSRLWHRTSIPKTIVTQIQTTSISNLTFHVDDKKTDETGFDVYMLDQLLSFCSQLLTAKVTGQFWRSKMHWPPSILELDLVNEDEVDPPFPFDRQKTMESLRHLPNLRLLCLPRTILAGSYRRLICILDEKMTKARADCPWLRTVHIYPEEHMGEELDEDEEELLDGDEEDLPDLDFFKQLNSNIFQCGVVNFKNECIIIKFL